MTHSPAWITLAAADAEPADRARWLERALVGLDLSTVVTELVSLNSRPVTVEAAPPDVVRSWLGTDSATVLERGLGFLPRRKLDELFRNPGLLVGLQELALTEGGPYWDALLRESGDVNAVADKQRTAVLENIGLKPASRTPSHGAREPAEERRSAGPPVVPVHRRQWTRRALAVLAPLAAAAAVVLPFTITGLFPRQTAAPPVESDVPAVVVSGQLPDSKPRVADAPSSTHDAWEPHPLQDIGIDATKPTINAVDLRERLAGSREWARRLDESRDLSTTQLLAATGRARQAVSAVEKLASAVDAGFGVDQRLLVQDKCRTALSELDAIRATMSPDGKSMDDVSTVKSGIVRALDGVEKTLLEAARQGPPRVP